MKERSYLVIEAKEVRTVKEVIRSDGLWCFACGDVWKEDCSRISKIIFPWAERTNTKIQIHKYTNTQKQHITECQKDPTCGIFLKRGFSESSMYHLYIVSAPSVHHQRIISASSAHHQRIIALCSLLSWAQFTVV